MPSTYSTNLALELIGTGDQAGVWGNTTNTNLGTLIEQAISGYVTQAVSTGADTTITIPNGATGVARNMYIELTGTGGTNTNLIVPSNKKLYFIFNNTSSGQVTVKVSGQTGVSVPNGKKVVLVSNGTDIVNGLNYIADFGTNSFTVTNLTATSATITTLTGTSAGITTISSGSANITQLQSTSATITTLTGTSANIATLSGTTATFTSATVTNLALTSVTLSNLNIASANITTLTSSSATISTTLALSGGTANGVLYLNGSKVATSGSALTFDGTNLALTTTNSIYRVPTAGGYLFDAGGNNGIYILGSSNYVATYTGGSEQMRLTSTGLGIGTSSPASKLDVNGAAVVRGTFTPTDAITMGGNTSAPTADAFIFRPANNTLAFGTANTERARIDSSGNLGLGVTPSAWTTFKVFQNQRSAFYSYSDGSPNAATGLAVNAFYDGNWKYIESLGAARYEQPSQGGGAHVWYNAPSGTAGNAITWTQAMTLDASGNLGLGVTPSAWNSFTGAFQFGAVGGLASADFGGSNVQTFFGNNVYYGGSPGNFRAIKTNVSAIYRQIGTAHSWGYSESTTADGVITFTTPMTLDASGNLGVGTTSPGSRLHISQSGVVSFYIASTSATDQENQIVSFYNSGAAYGTLNYDGALHKFKTSGTERARITSAGDVGIGTSSPGFKLDVVGSVGLNSAGTSVLTTFGASNNTDKYIRIRNSDGNFEIGTAAAGHYLYGNGAIPLQFFTNATERARITSGGFFKASNSGTYNNSTSSNHELYSNSSNNVAVVISHTGTSGQQYGALIQTTNDQNDATRYFLSCTGGATERATIRSNGGFANYSANDVNLASDERLKKDISPLNTAWNKVKGIEVVNYRYKDCNEGDPLLYGVIAQQVQPIVPELVVVTREATETDPEYYGIREQPMYWLAIKALQEAMARIEKLEAEMAALKGA